MCQHGTCSEACYLFEVYHTHLLASEYMIALSKSTIQMSGLVESNKEDTTRASCASAYVFSGINTGSHASEKAPNGVWNVFEQVEILPASRVEVVLLARILSSVCKQSRTTLVCSSPNCPPATRQGWARMLS
jgi:hypothetical protein